MFARTLLALLSPPIAVCRFGCAGCCAAPIGVFWLAGIVSMIYGSVGGPANLAGPSWNTIGLGIVLWVVASAWAALAIRGRAVESCAGKTPGLCASVLQEGREESDPFEDVPKAR